MIISATYADELREIWRSRILEAMDRAMEEVWRQVGVEPKDNLTGARDEDLPDLFSGLDCQFVLNVEYQGHEVEP